MPNNTVHNILYKLAELRDSMEWWIECEFAKSAWCLRYHVGFTSIRSSFQFASSNKLLPKLYRDQTRIQSNKCLYVTNRNFCKYLHFIEMKTCTLNWKSPIGFKKKNTCASFNKYHFILFIFRTFTSPKPVWLSLEYA